MFFLPGGATIQTEDRLGSAQLVVRRDGSSGRFAVRGRPRRPTRRGTAGTIALPGRHSSAVEQLFRKQQVLGSNPSVGSTFPAQNGVVATSLSLPARLNGSKVAAIDVPLRT